MRFRFLTDRLFLASCGGYAINRWLLKPRVHSHFLRFWFNDLLLIPCAIPVLFWCFRLFNLRRESDPPRALELAWILTVWSVLFEWVGPHLVARATGDWLDVMMYWLGGLMAYLVWNRDVLTGTT